MSWFAHTVGMLLSDGVARLLLVLHTVLAVAAVAAATHLLIWLRRSIKRSDARFASTKRFASYALVLHFAAFVVGNVMYPTYKLRVRVAYLENPVAISTDLARRDADRARIEATAPPSAAADGSRTDAQALAGARIARWFDVKEHLLAFGLGALLAVWLITRRWQPQFDDGIGIVVVSLAGFAAVTGWVGAIIGVLTAAWRAI